MLSINARECEIESSFDCAQQKHYKKEVQQIRKLTAHYRCQVKGLKKALCVGENLGNGEDKDVSFGILGHECSGSSQCTRKQENGQKLHMFEDLLGVVGTSVNEEKADVEQTSSQSKRHPSDSHVGENCSGMVITSVNKAPAKDEDVKPSRGKGQDEFTPVAIWERKMSIPTSDNRGSNGCQPMIQWDTVISVVNMPSLTQGQAFNTISPDSKVLSSRPLSGYAPELEEGPRLSMRGWRREVRSATMYERYQESPLTPGHVRLDAVSDTGISGEHARAAAGNIRYKMLTKDQSLKSLSTSEAADIRLLKLRKAKELESERKPMLEPISVRPRDHWYEMKSPLFHLEARRNNEHLRMLCT